MSDKREPVAWITKNGKHIPIFADSANEDEIRKEKQTADNKAQADSKNLEEKYKHINPGFKANASHLDPAGYNNNCVKCALAFEANMRGNDVEAKPFVFADSGELDKVRQASKAFKDADVWNVGRNKREMVVREIELTLNEDWGKGSRGIIQIRSAQTKHTMNVINQEGKVIVIDAQAGKQGSVSQMLKGLPTKDVHLFRTDNLSINEEYKDWAYRRRK